MADFKIKDLKSLLKGAYTSGISDTTIDNIIKKSNIKRTMIGSCYTINENALFSILIYFLSGKQITPADYNNSPFDVQTLIQYLRTNNTAQVNNTVSNKDLEDKISELEKENERLREENEVLKTGASKYVTTVAELADVQKELDEAKELLESLCNFIDKNFTFTNSDIEHFKKVLNKIYERDPERDKKLREQVLTLINDIYLLDIEKANMKVKSLCNIYEKSTINSKNWSDKTNKLQHLRSELDKLKRRC